MILLFFVDYELNINFGTGVALREILGSLVFVNVIDHTSSTSCYIITPNNEHQQKVAYS